MNQRTLQVSRGFWMQPGALISMALIAVLATGIGFLGGYQFGNTTQSTTVVDGFRTDLKADHDTLVAIKRDTQNNLDALTLKLGKVQAHLMRLDALGERLTEIASLDVGEFDFSIQPALGGPEESLSSESGLAPEFQASMLEIEKILAQRESQLTALESLLISRNLADEIRPQGRPVNAGWISSLFGKRTDPFTGKKTSHHGVDFAGKSGSDVIAVASGVVSASAKRSGYGNMVEIRHGGGFVTRYGHNKENLVAVGDRVEKGQVIALMGSTGRSTGPHVHFEVVRNGSVVDPSKYLRVSR